MWPKLIKYASQLNGSAYNSGNKLSMNSPMKLKKLQSKASSACLDARILAAATVLALWSGHASFNLQAVACSRPQVACSRVAARHLKAARTRTPTRVTSRSQSSDVARYSTSQAPDAHPNALRSRFQKRFQDNHDDAEAHTIYILSD